MVVSGQLKDKNGENTAKKGNYQYFFIEITSDKRDCRSPISV